MNPDIVLTQNDFADFLLTLIPKKQELGHQGDLAKRFVRAVQLALDDPLYSDLIDRMGGAEFEVLARAISAGISYE